MLLWSIYLFETRESLKLTNIGIKEETRSYLILSLGRKSKSLILTCYESLWPTLHYVTCAWLLDIGSLALGPGDRYVDLIP